MPEILIALSALASGATLAVLLLSLRTARSGAAVARMEAIERGIERLERSMRDDAARAREEAAQRSRELRDEVGVVLQRVVERLDQHRLESADAQQKTRSELSSGLKGATDSLLKQLAELTKKNEEKLEALRATVDGRLQKLHEDNANKLEEMRKTVDEKLQGTLEKRLGESFKLVSERLEQVHKGLGEMQSLATGVGDLKRVLTNVKTRGTWGEVQLEQLLEQVLAPEQYARNVATRRGSNERVEFAIRLPGQDGDARDVVWLPVDAKFPQEDYQRLVDSSERGDSEGVEQAGKQLEARIKQCARDIHDKYVSPPETTDFGILFLPTEGLYAEVLRRPGLLDFVQREHRVAIAGPTTLLALLNSLQMGFRTLAIQKRSSEVWEVLGAVKTEFGKFGGVLEKVQKKLHEASKTIDDAQVRTRAIERNLRHVQELPTGQTQPTQLLIELDPHGQDLPDSAIGPV